MLASSIIDVLIAFYTGYGPWPTHEIIPKADHLLWQSEDLSWVWIVAVRGYILSLDFESVPKADCHLLDSQGTW